MKKIVTILGMILGVNSFSKQSVIATTYTYPDSKNSFWSTVVSLGGSKIPYALINPNSGVGEKIEVNYMAQIKRNKKVGIKNIAYIPTTYQKRNIQEVKAEVDKYFSLYGKDNINGFFFDEIAVTKENEVKYMKEIFDYVKSKSQNNIVIANPGNQITDEISSYADIWVTSEVSANTYINKFDKPKSKFENNTSNNKHIWHIIHSAKPEEYKKIIELSRERNAGWLMITDDLMPNPYDKMPTEFVKIVNMINK